MGCNARSQALPEKEARNTGKVTGATLDYLEIDGIHLGGRIIVSPEGPAAAVATIIYRDDGNSRGR